MDAMRNGPKPPLASSDTPMPPRSPADGSADEGGPQPLRAGEGIEDNLRFLIIEVDKQLSRTGRYLQNPEQSALTKIIESDDYIDNLKAVIVSKSFAAAAEGCHGHETVALLRTYEVIASNLERIADFCEKVIVQVSYIDNPAIYARYDFRDFLAEVVAGVELIEPAVFEPDVQVALGICRTEYTTDHMYAVLFNRVLAELHSGATEETQSLVTVLFIAHYLERMGDALLNIGEAILSAHLGERIKIEHLRALEDSLELSELSTHLGQLSLASMGETKSGTRVNSLLSRAEQCDSSRPRPVICKEGKTHKLIKERDNIARWEELMPGLAPRIYSFHEGEEDGAILFEYLPGATFESILLRKTHAEALFALDAIERKLLEVWSRTRRPERATPRFLGQLSSRFEDVLAAHPEFRHGDGRIGDMEVASFVSLIRRLWAHDEALAAPFSVFIHGDFNVDNVIYDRARDSVRFIDLHRSRMMDYVQDVSVFLVSQFRLRCLEAALRRRIGTLTLRFHDFARAYARSIGDISFDERLALGVARSLATSTRFVLDRKLARSMFLRARYILERLSERCPGGSGSLDRQLTREVLVD
jgi:phosphate uptake regulator/aminoglycoside phosphotransferase (APT) family kinase protein